MYSIAVRFPAEVFLPSVPPGARSETIFSLLMTTDLLTLLNSNLSLLKVADQMPMCHFQITFSFLPPFQNKA